jgi:hypothetical protein
LAVRGAWAVPPAVTPAFSVGNGFGFGSPLVEAVLSLHVLVEPKHHPLQHEFVRRMRALSPSLRRRIGELAFVYRRMMPDYVLYSIDAERLAPLSETLLAFLGDNG